MSITRAIYDTYGNLLFEHSGPFNTDGHTIHQAMLQKVDLSHANLAYWDLRNCFLQGLDLSQASLSFAIMQKSNLHLCNLSNVSMCGTIGNGKQIKSLQLDGYNIAYTADRMQIGCQNYLISEWLGFTDAAIEIMFPNQIRWAKVWKPIIKKILKHSPAER